MGLTSRAGVIPLSTLADVAGPMARTVEDALKVFQVIVGSDPNDPVTAPADAHLSRNYADSLQPGGLKGAVIGILRQAYERETTDPEVVRVFMAAVADLKKAGATIVDPATIEGLTDIRRPRGVGSCQGFKYDINHYLESRGEQVPVRSLADIIKSGGFHPSVQRRLETAEKDTPNGPDSEACQADREYREKYRQAVVKAMEQYKLDAFAYPTWSNPPRLIGDLNTPHGDNSQVFAPTTGFPAITVPMGYTRGGTLPAGITFFGRAWSEPLLLKLSYAWEQATHHRRAPAATPLLR
jgi:Asp-tRNA(Asn)/Glu-tRNA(Gln) amidotransferase A subunit family amidase